MLSSCGCSPTRLGHYSIICQHCSHIFSFYSLTCFTTHYPDLLHRAIPCPRCHQDWVPDAGKSPAPALGFLNYRSREWICFACGKRNGMTWGRGEEYDSDEEDEWREAEEDFMWLREGCGCGYRRDYGGCVMGWGEWELDEAEWRESRKWVEVGLRLARGKMGWGKEGSEVRGGVGGRK